ncbi:MAG: periplasmic heavy metal sensor [Pseudomonadota bacterium]|nr:periplasmic heavy metal sensor [Pseudomonadota bacterium]MBU1398520.1 periplasmic heavy metal sensor [Pseudomonadota bacterium]MBU1570718.1 periplasmic heavy metal sensor [Pseudomonadota bacterium]
MLKIKTLSIILIVFAVLTANAIGGQRHKANWWNDPEISKQLNLSENEKQRLDALYIESGRKMIELKSIVEKERFELRALLENKSENDDAIKGQFRKLENARSALADERLQFLIQTRAILGIERFKELRVYFENLPREGRRNKSLP